jgi:hypothetical protein
VPQIVQQLIPGLVEFLHRHLPAVDAPTHTQRKEALTKQVAELKNGACDICQANSMRSA